MLFWIIGIALLGAIAADVFRYRRLRRTASPAVRIFFALWAAATDALPLVIVLVSVLSRDNGTAFMYAAQWMFWVWMLTVLPRMVFYLFEGLRLRWVGLTAALLLAVVLVWGATAGRTTIRVNRVEVCSPRLPASFDGVRIAQFSDAHLGTLVDPERNLQRLVDTIRSLRPDLVAFTGDLVNVRYTELDSTAMRILGSLRAPYGVFTVAGNHDAGFYIKDTLALPPKESFRRVMERQREMGWCVLEDSTRYLHRGDDSISVSGLSFDPALRKLRHASDIPRSDFSRVYAAVPDTLFNITLSHLPQLWPQIAEAGYGDLTLAGHVHSMQLKLRILGRDFSPAQWLYKRWSGRYGDDGSTLYINDGVGHVVFPMRLGASPEVTLFTLRRCE